MSHISDANTLFEFIRKYIIPSLDVKDDRTFEQKLTSVIADIENKKKNLYIVEKLCCVLENHLIEVHKKMKDNEDDYHDFLIEIVESILNNFDETISVWKDRLIYFRNVKEVWIACEPLLELIDNAEGGFDLLERQLKHVEKITYFLTTKTYFDEIIKILKDRQFEEEKISKLQYRIIPKKLIHPIVIYIRKNNNYHGMAGRSYPDITKETDGYYFRIPLPTDWLYYLPQSSIQKYHDTLKEHI